LPIKLCAIIILSCYVFISHFIRYKDLCVETMCRINIKILATEDIFFLLSNVDLKYQLEEVIQNFAFFSPAEVHVWENPFHNRSFFL